MCGIDESRTKSVPWVFLSTVYLVSSKKRRLENQSSLQKKNILCLSYWKVFDQKQEEEEEEEDEHGFGEARLRWCAFFSFVLLSFFVVVVAEERMNGSKLAKWTRRIIAEPFFFLWPFESYIYIRVADRSWRRRSASSLLIFSLVRTRQQLRTPPPREGRRRRRRRLARRDPGRRSRPRRKLFFKVGSIITNTINTNLILRRREATSRE